MQVFVLLFNARTENEGIHTIRIGDRNLVLLFEDEDDATRYALLLEAQDFPTPSVEAIDRQEMEAFCESAGYESQFVPKGFVPESDSDRLLLAPPTANLEATDWNAESKSEQAEASKSDDTMPESELERIRHQLERLL